MNAKEFRLKLAELMFQHSKSNNCELPAMIDALQVLLEAAAITAITVRERGSHGDAVQLFDEVLGVMSDVYSNENLMQGVH
jgi:hypothetical protein